MRLGFGEIFAGAGDLWRSDSDLLVPVAAIFFFLPVFAVLLFVPVPDLSGLEGEALNEAIVALFQARLPWFVGQVIVQTFGVGTVLVLLLDPARPSVSSALWQALVRLPGLMAARIIAFSGVVLGLLVFVVPGLYLIGRTFLTSAVYIAEPERGPAGAAILGFERTNGNGWLLFLVSSTVFFANYLLGGIADQGMVALAAGNAWMVFPFAAFVSAASSLMVLAMVLLEVAAYRALGAARQGM